MDQSGFAGGRQKGRRFKGRSLATADVIMPLFSPAFRLLDLWVPERGWLAAAKRGRRGKWDQGHRDIFRHNISTRQKNHQNSERSMGNLRNFSGKCLGGMLFHL